jgi:Flp pilus assembly protein TadB
VTGSSAIESLRHNPQGTLALAAMLLVVVLVIAGVGVACWALWTGRRKRRARLSSDKPKPIIAQRL